MYSAGGFSWRRMDGVESRRRNRRRRKRRRRRALPAITGARCSWERGAIHHVRDGRVMWREVMAFLSPPKQRGDH